MERTEPPLSAFTFLGNAISCKYRCYTIIVALLAVCALLTLHTVSNANTYKGIPPKHSWQTVFSEHPAVPSRLVAVDKKRQQLFLFENISSLKATKAYLCSTGQVAGDKYIEGDLRTPEGVYFVVQHLNSGLDFAMYGKEAYTLNYPNPVDKLRKKTGYGIWIHGRGSGIAPLQTQGCIALNNGDIALLGKLLKPGTPVVLSSTFFQSSTALKQESDKVNRLQNKVDLWIKAWGNRSSSLFEFYDKESYSISTESFDNFKKTKERLFKSLPWIKTSIMDVQVLQGPDYWVTWFYQSYDAPNLSTQGVRRLYWGEDNLGKFKVIGMEWIPGQTATPLPHDPAYPPLEITPRTEPLAPVDTLPDGNIAMIDHIKNLQDQQGEEEKNTIASKKTGKTMASLFPALSIEPEVSTPPPTLPDSIKVEESNAPSALHQARASQKIINESTSKKRLTAALVMVEAWRSSWQSGDIDEYMAFYAPTTKQGNRYGKNAIKIQKKKLWQRAKPALVTLRNIQVTAIGAENIRAEMVQEYKDSTNKGDKGIKILTISFPDNKPLIVNEEWRKAP